MSNIEQVALKYETCTCLQLSHREAIDNIDIHLKSIMLDSSFIYISIT